MNSSEVCHDIADCPGLYVDGFRGKYLKLTQNTNNCFILTHYHGDHYQSLPRDGKYSGPALIHCTPVTAALLIDVHKVPAVYVVEHEYGHTFQYYDSSDGGEGKMGKKKKDDNNRKVVANVTFYDANHCPGACIVLIQLPNNGTTHLHTGDMRYNDRLFKSYPLLREAVVKKQCLDLVYLDTTYSHPRHDFLSQEEAVEAISSHTESLFTNASKSNTKMLVLLSCYSIGKEKVLWEVSTRNNNKMVYVSEKKMKMLKCVQRDKSQVSSQIIQRCTLDPEKSDIHVIPMGLVGEMFPYFQPNFVKCKEYVENLVLEYDKVVAFLPTGWANASKWNKKHNINKKRVTLLNGRALDIEIRLVAYSEHSSFSELIDCVKYLHPRKVIPTVFSDEADYRKIESRFRNYLDTAWARMAFFGQHREKSTIDEIPTSSKITIIDKQSKKCVPSTNAKEDTGYDDININFSEVKQATIATTTPSIPTKDVKQNNTSIVIDLVEKCTEDNENATSVKSLQSICNVSELRAEELLVASNGSLTRAIDICLHQQQPTLECHPVNTPLHHNKKKRHCPLAPTPSASLENPCKKQGRINSFFQKDAQRKKRSKIVLKDSYTQNGGREELERERNGDAELGLIKIHVIKCVEENKKGDAELEYEVSFERLSEALQRIADTTKRLLKIELLVTFINDIILNTKVLEKASVLSAALHLTLGLRSSIEQAPLEVSGSAVSKSLQMTLGLSRTQISKSYRQLGDLGDSAAFFFQNKTNFFTKSTAQARLSIIRVYALLQEIVTTRGRDAKQQILHKLIRSCQSKSELCFMVRLLVGNMRIGANIKTVLAALATSVVSSGGGDGLDTKAAVELLRLTYDVCPNLKMIISSLLKGGCNLMKKECRMQVLTPISPMLAHPAHSLEQVENFMKEKKSSAIMEWKYDGVRCQAHWDGTTMKLFSRHMLETTAQYPDVVKSILDSKKDVKLLNSFILDTEIVAVEKFEKGIRLLPFQELSKRKRINVEGQKVQVKVFVFDIMLLNGTSYTDQPLWKRQQVLRDHFEETENFAFVSSQTLPLYGLSEITQFLEKAISGGAEGLMLKLLGKDLTTVNIYENSQVDSSNLTSPYESGSRSHSWLKVKRDYVAGYSDTIDVVPIGAWYGNGRKAQKSFLSPVLLAVYDKDEDVYRSISRCLSFTDAMYEGMREFYLRGTPYPNQDTEYAKNMENDDQPNVGDDDFQEMTHSSCESMGIDENMVNCYPTRPSSAFVITNESPPIWFKPLEVYEVTFADLTLSRQHTAGAGLINDPEGRGVALRFPRFKRRRPDKRPDQATTTHQIARLFANQIKKVAT